MFALKNQRIGGEWFWRLAAEWNSYLGKFGEEGMGEKQRIFHPGELGKIILSPYIFVFCIERVAHVGAL